MKIYTKTGDKGETSLFGGNRLLKSHIRIDTYGTIDELNAHIGMVRDQNISENHKKDLVIIQELLFSIGSILATGNNVAKLPVPMIENENIEFLEKAIDQMNETLPAMRNFILPGGHVSVSAVHIARCVCRRAERITIELAQIEKTDEIIIKFLNRLSDYLFVLARKIGSDLGVEETPWMPKNKKTT